MKYAIVFTLLSLVLALYALILQGPGWLLLWPAFSFLWVAGAYAGLGARLLGKRPNGQMAWWSLPLLFPYLLLTWGLWHLHRLTSSEDPWNEVAPGIFLGRRPLPGELPAGVTLIIDLTAEFSEPRAVRMGRTVICLPVLDAHVPRVAELWALIERVANHPGPVYLHCALGHGRSALAACALLIARGLARDAEEAESLVRKARPAARLNRVQRSLLSSG
jgi:protein-tyrosine phosphatase